jgi:predicted heme/steroid binding protein
VEAEEFPIVLEMLTDFPAGAGFLVHDRLHIAVEGLLFDLSLAYLLEMIVRALFAFDA